MKNEQELKKKITRNLMGVRNVSYKEAKIIKELTFKGNIMICSGCFEQLERIDIS
jgi:hypothetical protein